MAHTVKPIGLAPTTVLALAWLPSLLFAEQTGEGGRGGEGQHSVEIANRLACEARLG
jgi:hypothetical protein